MPRAVPPAARQDIVERHLRGQTLRQIAAELAIPFGTVRDLWRGFRDAGADGLALGYHTCGCSTPCYSEAVLRRACRLRRQHTGRGAGRVRVELLESPAPDDVPSGRVLRRAFQRAGIDRPRRPRRLGATPRLAAAPHEVWQVDAVEKARLKTGAAVRPRAGGRGVGPGPGRPVPLGRRVLPPRERRGAIRLYGRGRGRGLAHHGKEVCVRFDPASRHWVVSDHQGRELKRLAAEELSRGRILSLSVGHRRPGRKRPKRG